VLVIFAPEDVQDLNHPYPLPPEERILYISSVPRDDAGAEEAYVIRLLQEQLERFHIATGLTELGYERDVTMLAGPTLRAAKLRDGLRAALDEQRTRARRETEEARRNAQAKVAMLSAIPASLRNADARRAAYLISSKADLPRELPTLQKSAVNAAIDRLRAAKTRPTMRLYLTADQVSELQLQVDGNKVGGVVSAEALRKTVPEIGGITDLVRVRTDEPPSPDALEKRYLSDSPEQEEAAADAQGADPLAVKPAGPSLEIDPEIGPVE
jgi:hypothetical protein